jgi:tetratricopeptide (TPR) repeat protein
MRTTVLNSACMVCLLLILTAPVATCQTWEDRVPRVFDETVAEPSDSAIPPATLLRRAREQAKVPASGVDSGSFLARELWSSRITAPQTSEDADASLALKRLIRQVRSVRFDSKDPPPTFTAPAESRPVIRSALAAPATTQTPEQPVPPAESGAPQAAAGQTMQAQKTHAALREHRHHVRDPLEMAELLFLSGQATEAAPFYAEALDRLSNTEPSYDADRAWVLFQLGNCLRETDTAKAQEAYTKLISEYPDSPWTELARAHGRLLAWYRKNPSDQSATLPQL